MSKALVVFDGSVPEARLSEFLSENSEWFGEIPKSSISFERLDRVSSLTESEYVAVAVLSDTAPSRDSLKLFCKALKPQGTFLVSCSHVRDIMESFQLLGLLDITIKGSVAAARKPNSVAANILVRRKQNMKDLVKNISSSEPTVLLSDAELLNEEDVAKKTNIVVDACGPSSANATALKKKACKNCSCGLKEEEEKVAASGGAAASAPDSITAKSSCGNCYLGDAFRCSSCPYRGLPAFKAGEQVQLPSSILQDDI